MSPLVLTMWRSFALGRRRTISWADLLAIVAAPEVVRAKRDVAGFSLASFAGDRRSLERVERVHALCLDFDHGAPSIRRIARLFRGLRAVVYTTWSSTPEAPRLRVIILLDRPVDAAQYAIVWQWAADRCARAGLEIDESTKDASRFWYLPSRRPDGVYEWRELRGRAIDVRAVLKRGARTPRPLPGGGPAPSKSKVSRRQEVGEVRPLPTCPARESFFGRAFALAGMDLTPMKKNGAPKLLANGALVVECPWVAQHTGGLDDDGKPLHYDGDTSTVVLAPTSESKWGIFKCSHGHCAHRTTLDLLDVLPASALAAARHEHGGGLVRARVTRGHVDHLEALPGFAALDRLALWCVPVGGGQGFLWTIKLGSAAHHALDGLRVDELRGRRVDVAFRGREITWGRLAPEQEGRRT